jgi:hypothetical protein
MSHAYSTSGLHGELSDLNGDCDPLLFGLLSVEDRGCCYFCLVLCLLLSGKRFLLSGKRFLLSGKRFLLPGKRLGQRFLLSGKRLGQRFQLSGQRSGQRFLLSGKHLALYFQVAEDEHASYYTETGYASNCTGYDFAVVA